MTLNKNKEIIRRYMDALRKDKSAATLDKYIAEDELKEHIAMFEAVFPGYWLDAHDIIAEDDLVSVRATLHGVHKGQLMDVPATGKTVTAPLFIIYRMANDKIVQHWMLADMFSIMQQIRTPVTA